MTLNASAAHFVKVVLIRVTPLKAREAAKRPGRQPAATNPMLKNSAGPQARAERKSMSFCSAPITPVIKASTAAPFPICRDNMNRRYQKVLSSRRSRSSSRLAVSRRVASARASWPVTSPTVGASAVLSAIAARSAANWSARSVSSSLCRLDQASPGALANDRDGIALRPDMNRSMPLSFPAMASLGAILACKAAQRGSVARLGRSPAIAEIRAISRANSSGSLAIGPAGAGAASSSSADIDLPRRKNGGGRGASTPQAEGQEPLTSRGCTPPSAPPPVHRRGLF